ncbi:38973_t:CDS:2 [Gigaspora margarita]|uniref:38973_t:CDS:1 n=1 Tax=Gigaspora margarita TaxID=4874 RepID=A0ABN7UK82_GIGMA|nr:38973_t:CDS:2 [Gigaspora margarita]
MGPVEDDLEYKLIVQTNNLTEDIDRFEICDGIWDGIEMGFGTGF